MTPRPGSRTAPTPTSPAIVMAEEARAEGENAEAVRLAGTIIDDQTVEITEMTNLLNAL